MRPAGVQANLLRLVRRAEGEQPRGRRLEEPPVQFTVGLKLQGKIDHISVNAEDALIAALKVKSEHPDAAITYVRQQNCRGDARHPSHALSESARGMNEAPERLQSLRSESSGWRRRVSSRVRPSRKHLCFAGERAQSNNERPGRRAGGRATVVRAECHVTTDKITQRSVLFHYVRSKNRYDAKNSPRSARCCSACAWPASQRRKNRSWTRSSCF